MPKFEIRYGEFGYDPSPGRRYHYFDVRCGGTEERIAVGLSDQVWRLWGLGDRADGEEIERRVTLSYLKEHLTNSTTLAFHRVLLTVWEQPERGERRTVHRVAQEQPYEWKECGHRAGKQGEYYCSAAEQGDDWAGRTTLAICEACGLPSTDIACSNLVHPSTRSLRGMGQPWSRQLWDVQCELGRTVSEASAAECVPRGRDCWVQIWKPEEPALALGTQAPQFSIGEGIDHVNLAFGRRYGRKLIVIEHARSIEDLAGDCPTDDSFQHKLQVLAGLIEGMQLSGLLTKQEAEGSQGTVDLLERLAHRDFSDLPGEYVRKLRNINRLAAGYPRHAKVKNIDRAHTELGLSYPVSDYPKAWAIVRETFIQALRQLALHLD